MNPKNWDFAIILGEKQVFWDFFFIIIKVIKKDAHYFYLVSHIHVT